MKSYDDMTDHDGQGCLQPVLVIVAIVIALLCCVSCTRTPPKFTGTITSASGKQSQVVGTWDPGQSWAEKNLGPLGALLGTAFAILQDMIPAAVAP